MNELESLQALILQHDSDIKAELTQLITTDKTNIANAITLRGIACDKAESSLSMAEKILQLSLQKSGLIGRFYYLGAITLGSSVQIPVVDADTQITTKNGTTSVTLKKNATVKCLIGHGGEGNRAYLSIRVYKNGTLVAQYNCVDNLYSTGTAPGYFTFNAVTGDIIDVKFVSSSGDGALGAENNSCSAVLWFNE